MKQAEMNEKIETILQNLVLDALDVGGKGYKVKSKTVISKKNEAVDKILSIIKRHEIDTWTEACKAGGDAAIQTMDALLNLTNKK